MKEEIDQVRVNVPIKDLWRALTSDTRGVIPKALPDFVAQVDLLEGDGGLGSILLFKFKPHVQLSDQRDKISEYDESSHLIGVEILEGGPLDLGFSSLSTAFKLTEVSEAETLVDIKVLFETKPEHTYVPGQNMKEATEYLNGIVVYLVKNPS